MPDVSAPGTPPLAVRRQRHLEMLGICALAVLLAYLLDVGDAGTVHFAFLPGIPVPQTCFSKQLFGFDCPGCGLTRSFIYLVEGEWLKAWSMHRIGWLVFLLTVLQIPYRWLALRQPGRELIPIAAARWIGTILISLLIGNWLWGVMFLQSSHSN